MSVINLLWSVAERNMFPVICGLNYNSQIVFLGISASKSFGTWAIHEVAEVY